MGLPIYLTEFTFFGGTITQKSSKFPFSAEFSDFGKTENSLESVQSYLLTCLLTFNEFIFYIKRFSWTMFLSERWIANTDLTYTYNENKVR